MAAGHAEYRRRWPAATPGFAPAPDPLSFPRLFGAIHAPAMLDALVRAIKTWAPQVVVSETAALAAPLACELTGCVQVTHGFGMPPPDWLLQEAADAMADCWRSATGGPAPADAGIFRHLYLDIYPPALQLPERVRTVRIQRLQACVPQRAAGQALPGALSGQFKGLENWPLVYLSFGTVVNRAPALQAAAAALARLQVRTVVTVGRDGDVHLLDPLPANMHVLPFIAQADLLPHCSLVVSHGGSGTMLAGLAHGLPQLVLPQGADQFINAAALDVSGAGIALRMPDATADQLQDAVEAAAQTLLRDPKYQHQAARIAENMAAMPCADAVAARLEVL
jgi:UDP-N-acetylglucosamine transferase subunit ALG13